MKPIPEEFKLFVSLPEAGLIDGRIIIGDDKFVILYSDSYPPFFEMQAWAQKLLIREDVQPLIIDDEADEHFISCRSVPDYDDLVFLEYTRGRYPESLLYRAAFVRKYDVANEIFLILKFLNSIDFEYEESRNEGKRFWFHFIRKSDEITKFNLLKLENLLKTCRTHFV